MTRARLVQDMMKAQATVVDEVWARRPADLPLRSKDELVTLASIVERETGVPEERPRVAAVFLNRLKRGMRLQSDPTIIYGLVGGQGKLDRPLTRQDIDAATPYNTYQIDGLPPGPIAIPGRTALEAVVAPAATDELYFVADGSGGHAFARTLDEHNANVEKWRSLQAGTVLATVGAAEQATAGADGETANSTVIRPELPAPEISTEGPSGAAAAPAAEDAAIAEAALTQQGTQQVPSPSDSSAAGPASEDALPQLQTRPKPRPKPENAVVAEGAGLPAGDGSTGDARGRFVPGTVVEFGGRRIPVPLIKQKKL
jgi:hypothetical protein